MTCGAANVCVADLAGIVGITAPPGSSDAQSHPHDSGIYSVVVPPYPLAINSGIGYLINPTVTGGAADFTLHDHVYTSDYIPDPVRANVIFQFDQKAVVDQLQVIEHVRGITKIKAYVGDSLGAMTEIGDIFGSEGDETGWEVLTELGTNTFDFNNTLAGYYFQFVVTKTSWTNGWAAYRVFPADSTGTRYGPAQTPVVPVPGAAILGLLGLSFAGWRLRREAA
jgi:hypothetical protein